MLCQVEEALGIPAAKQRYWVWHKRQNCTTRPTARLQAAEEQQTLVDLKEYRLKEERVRPRGGVCLRVAAGACLTVTTTCLCGEKQGEHALLRKRTLFEPGCVRCCAQSVAGPPGPLAVVFRLMCCLLHLCAFLVALSGCQCQACSDGPALLP
jgi:hypothetical protein